MFCRDDLNAGSGGSEDDLGVSDDIALLIRRFAGNRFEIDTEALFRNCRALDDAINAAMGNKLNIRAFKGRDNG